MADSPLPGTFESDQGSGIGEGILDDLFTEVIEKSATHHQGIPSADIIAENITNEHSLLSFDNRDKITEDQKIDLGVDNEEIKKEHTEITPIKFESMQYNVDETNGDLYGHSPSPFDNRDEMTEDQRIDLNIAINATQDQSEMETGIDNEEIKKDNESKPEIKQNGQDNVSDNQQQVEQEYPINLFEQQIDDTPIDTTENDQQAIDIPFNDMIFNENKEDTEEEEEEIEQNQTIEQQGMNFNNTTEEHKQDIDFFADLSAIKSNSNKSGTHQIENIFIDFGKKASHKEIKWSKKYGGDNGEIFEAINDIDGKKSRIDGICLGHGDRVGSIQVRINGRWQNKNGKNEGNGRATKRILELMHNEYIQSLKIATDGKSIEFLQFETNYHATISAGTKSYV